MIFKDYLFKSKVPLMNSGLDAYALRNKTIAKNIANIETPGYKPETVKFEELFTNERRMKTGANSSQDSGDEEIPTPEVVQSEDESVNIDKEMSEMAQNQIRFRFASKMVKKYFSGLGSAISGFRE